MPTGLENYCTTRVALGPGRFPRSSIQCKIIMIFHLFFITIFLMQSETFLVDVFLDETNLKPCCSYKITILVFMILFISHYGV